MKLGAALIPNIILIALMTSGCSTANRMTAFRTFQNGNGQSTAVDAKQRFLNGKERATYDETGRLISSQVLCAEPSPDALSAFAASLDSSLSLSRGTSQASVGFGESMREAAGSIGLRTQTITILRDQLFRFCEGYANGAFDEAEFRRLHRRNQANQLGLLAIEQITGAVRGPASSLSAQVDSGPKDLESAIASLEARIVARNKIREELVAAQDNEKKITAQKLVSEGELSKADTALKSATEVTKNELLAKRALASERFESDKAALANAATSSTEATKSLKDRELSIAAAQANLDSARRRALGGASNFAFSDSSGISGGVLSSDSIQHITSASERIVTTIATTSYFYETCLDLLSPRGPQPENATTYLCRLALARAANAIDPSLLLTSDGFPQTKNSSPGKSAADRAFEDLARVQELIRTAPSVRPD